MRTQQHTIKGDTVSIHFYEGDQDREAFYDWLGQPRVALAFDTETTGLDIYSRGFSCRLAQFGDHLTSWVLPGRYADAIGYAVRSADRLVCHNSSHDLHVLDKHYGLRLEDTHPKTLDTFLISHIIDPRSPEDGAVGHGLKDLATYYVDPFCADGARILKDVFKANKWTSDTGWCAIPEDHPDFVLYAGLDTILTSRLLEKLLPMVREFKDLVAFEHKLQLVTAKMERKGILLDVEYTLRLQEELTRTETYHNEQVVRICRELGVAPLTPRGQRDVLDATFWALSMGGLRKRRASNGKQYVDMSAGSNQVIVSALLKMGETLTETTDSGALAIGKEILNDLCDVNKDDERLDIREPNVLAQHVKAAKRAGKWRSSYIDQMINTRDENDRIHPKISSLKARTGRMAISRPPFQQLPSSGRKIRDCLIADPGHELVSCDYDQVEMKLLAALTKDERMVQVMHDGLDIFNYTAEIIYGPEYTKKERGALKAAGYGTCYGGGPKTIAKQTGLTLAQAKKVQGQYLETYPGIKKYSKHLELSALEDPDLAIYNAMGRKLPVDKDRMYAVLNYMIQSSARDVFAQAIIRMDEAGLTDYMLLPVHDEMIGQAPVGYCKDLAKKFGENMSTDYDGVALTAEGDVIGNRWGLAYHDKKLCSGDKENCECP